MEKQFWHDKWAKREIGFHESRPNGLLVDHLHRLKLAAGGRIFVPLCGKTLDIGWLLEQDLGKVDAVYDRAAYVALPPQMRSVYTEQLRTLSEGVPQLLITFEYDQSLMNGPPFAVHQPDIHKRYGSHYHIEALHKREIEGGFKGKVPAAEAVWALYPAP